MRFVHNGKLWWTAGNIYGQDLGCEKAAWGPRGDMSLDQLLYLPRGTLSSKLLISTPPTSIIIKFTPEHPPFVLFSPQEICGSFHWHSLHSTHLLTFFYFINSIILMFSWISYYF